MEALEELRVSIGLKTDGTLEPFFQLFECSGFRHFPKRSLGVVLIWYECGYTMNINIPVEVDFHSTVTPNQVHYYWLKSIKTE